MARVPSQGSILSKPESNGRQNSQQNGQPNGHGDDSDGQVSGENGARA